MFRQTGWILHQQAANTALLFFSISGALRQKHVFKFIVSQISGKIGKRCRNRRPQRNSALIFYLVTEQGGWNPRILCLEWDKRVEGCQRYLDGQAVVFKFQICKGILHRETRTLHTWHTIQPARVIASGLGIGGRFSGPENSGITFVLSLHMQRKKAVTNLSPLVGTIENFPVPKIAVRTQCDGSGSNPSDGKTCLSGSIRVPFHFSTFLSFFSAYSSSSALLHFISLCFSISCDIMAKNRTKFTYGKRPPFLTKRRPYIFSG